VGECTGWSRFAWADGFFYRRVYFTKLTYCKGGMDVCDYCETAYYKNDSGREFGKLFDKTLDYTGEIQLSWIKESGMKTGYELYMNDNDACTDLSVPVDFCPKCGRSLNPHN
jgi:hypothetical protein